MAAGRQGTDLAGTTAIARQAIANESPMTISNEPMSVEPPIPALAALRRPTDAQSDFEIFGAAAFGFTAAFQWGFGLTFGFT